MKRLIKLSSRAIGTLMFTAVIAVATLSFLSFKTKMYGDFLSQLGMAKDQANEKITTGFLQGYLDHYSIRNLKSIATGDRAAIVKDVAAYAKQYVSSDAFRKEYAAFKQQHKPSPLQKIVTPEEMRADMIKQAKESIESTKETIKKATPELKPIFEKMLEASKQNLKNAEDPNNPNLKAYAQNFASMKKMMEENQERIIDTWQTKYPDDYMPMIKSRLKEFLAATENVDFAAQTKDSKGKKIFVNPAYERKDNQWKMAYRAGKEPVEAARAFVQQWINEIQ